MNSELCHRKYTISSPLALLLVILSIGAASPNVLVSQDVPFKVNLDFAQFRYQENEIYLEVYYSFRIDQLAYIRQDELLVGTIGLDIQITKTDEGEQIINRHWQIPNQIDLASTALRHPPGVGQTESRLQCLNSPNAYADPVKMQGAARELEAYFLHVLIREMRKTVPPNPVLYGGKAEEIFQDFLDEEISKELAASGQLGLADLVYKSLENLLKQTPENADKYGEGKGLNT